jgi:hypothetical protein
LVAGVDRPGRRFPGEDQNRRSDLRLVMLEWPVPPSCGLDLLERSASGDLSAQEIATALGVMPRRYRDIRRSAIGKLREARTDLDDFEDGER